MDLIVLVKNVPDTREADITIGADGCNIIEKDLVFDINESDKYAVEAAVQLKEKFKGSVTAITLGTENSEDVLRKCLAMGVDSAIRLTDVAFTDSDASATARILVNAIKTMKYDLVLTGVQSSDNMQGQVGGTVARLLGLPHCTVVNNLSINEGIARVHRELEGGREDVIEVRLPAVITIQTGINEPRYVSIMGIKKASRLEIKVLDQKGLNINTALVGKTGSQVHLESSYIPSSTKNVEILTGTLDETATKLAGIIKEKGGTF